jgi:hypothetical protein
MQTRTLFGFCLGVCSLVLLTVTSGLAQDSNMIQPGGGQTSIVKHGERHDPNQAQSSTSPTGRDLGTFYQPNGDEMKLALPKATARKGDQLVSAPSTTKCSQQLPWCWPSMSRAFSAAYTSFGADAIKRCNWCRARR